MTRKEQGEIWWANLPAPLNWRPVLILTRTDAISKLLWVTVAPLTRTMRRIQSEVVLEPDDDGVPQQCAVTLDNIYRHRRTGLVDSAPGDALDDTDG
jgi:mRNA interferase MazF